MRRHIDIHHFNNALHTLARAESQTGRDDYAEQAETADHQRKQVGVFIAAAAFQFAVGGEQGQMFDVVADGTHAQTTTVGIGGNRTAERHLVNAGLFLADRPAPALRVAECFGGSDDAGPVGTGLDMQQTALRVAFDHPVQRPQIQMQAVLRKLLAAHGMAGAGHRNFPAFGTRLFQQPAHIVEIFRPFDTMDVGGIETGMHIIEQFRHFRLPS